MARCPANPKSQGFESCTLGLVIYALNIDRHGPLDSPILNAEGTPSFSQPNKGFAPCESNAAQESGL